MLVKSKIVFKLMDLYKRVNSLSLKQWPCCGQVSCVTCMWIIVATLCYKCIHTKVVLCYVKWNNSNKEEKKGMFKQSSCDKGLEKNKTEMPYQS
jgi:hypothetical protein